MIKYSKQEIKNKNYKYLCYTNLLLVIPLLYFLLNKQKNTSIIEYILASFLIIIMISSQLFWNNPIKKSKIHKIDAIIAKIVIMSFVLYTFLYKFNYKFLYILLAIIISFYFSNYYSNKEWCSNKHIFYHGLLHIFCFIGSFYTFSPVSKINNIPMYIS